MATDVGNTLNLAQDIAHHYLGTFVNQSNFQSSMNLIFGNQWNASSFRQVSMGWSEQSFNQLPVIEVLQNNELNGANGAFSSETNSIYLAKDYLTGQVHNPAAIAAVLLEEIGHWIDSQINVVDEIGDEGDRFQRVVRGVNITPQDWLTLATEDDTAAITIDGKTLFVEQSSTLESSRNQNGRLESFMIGSDGVIYQRSQPALNGFWGNWVNTQGFGKELEVVEHLNGRLELFAIGLDDQVWHRWQTAPNGGWSGWSSMGLKGVTEIEAARNQDGRLELFAIGADYRLWQRWQTSETTWSNWTETGRNAVEIDVARDRSGRLSVFAIDSKDSAVWQRSQIAPNGRWESWITTGGKATDLEVTQNQTGGLEVFAVGLDNQLYHRWQTAPTNAWSGWSSLGGQVAEIEVNQTADNRLVVFAIGTDNQILSRQQIDAVGNWATNWSNLGGAAVEIESVRNLDGRLELFVVGTDKGIYHRWQPRPNSGFTNWGSFNGSSQPESATRILYGGLGAEPFNFANGYQRTVISGNGNVDYETLRDRLTGISLASIANWNPATANGGGVRYNPGNGIRLFDQLLLKDGREILLEGIEQVIFSDRPTSFNERLLEININQNLAINPTDPLFLEQWNLHMTGVHTAWRFTQGSDQVLLGIEDSGLGVKNGTTEGWHEDLRERQTTYLIGNIDSYSAPEDDPKLEFHGTPVQGIIAAKSNNKEGMSGINWNSRVFHIDVIGGDQNDLDLVLSTQTLIDEVKKTGQQLIINMSLSSKIRNNSGIFVDTFDRTDLSSELNKLVAENSDVLFVIATGNSGAAGVGLAYPAALAKLYSNVISVGAASGKTDSSGQPRTPGTRISYSQYGEGLTLLAPSEHLTTRATLDSLTREVEFDYSLFDGTSAAAPNVTGIASLVWSANSKLAATQVKQILSETAIDLGTPGYDSFTGHGFVNADAAVRRALAIAT